MSFSKIIRVVGGKDTTFLWAGLIFKSYIPDILFFLNCHLRKTSLSLSSWKWTKVGLVSDVKVSSRAHIYFDQLYLKFLIGERQIYENICRMLLYRSSHLEVFCKKAVARNFAKFTGKYLCQSFFFNKVASLRPATLLKKSLWHKCFPLNFAKFLRTSFVTEHLWWLPLSVKSNETRFLVSHTA